MFGSYVLSSRNENQLTVYCTMIELYEDVTPLPKRNRSLPAAEAHRLRTLAKAQQEARLAAFDKTTTIRGSFK